MKKKALFFHAGCPICVSAERQVALSLDPARFDVELVHLGESRSRVDEAKRLGVKSIPALVIDSEVFHINHAADLSEL